MTNAQAAALFALSSKTLEELTLDDISEELVPVVAPLSLPALTSLRLYRCWYYASIGRFLARHASQLVCLGLKAICRPRHDGVTNIEDLISLPLTRLRSLEIADLRPEISTNEFTRLIRSAPNLTALTVSDYKIRGIPAAGLRHLVSFAASPLPPDEFELLRSLPLPCLRRVKAQPSDLSLLLADGGKLLPLLEELYHLQVTPPHIALLMWACNVKSLAFVGPFLVPPLWPQFPASHFKRLCLHLDRDTFTYAVVAHILTCLLNSAPRLEVVQLEFSYNRPPCCLVRPASARL